MPWPVTAALVNELRAQGQLAAAGATLVAFVLVLRPAETLKLAGGSLEAPKRGVAQNRHKWSVVLHSQVARETSEVRAQDECVVFDSPEFGLEVPLLDSLRESEAAGRPLFPLGASQRQEALKAAAGQVLPSLAPPTLHQPGHGRACHEALTLLRSTEGLLLRGRWQSLRSVER